MEKSEKKEKEKKRDIYESYSGTSLRRARGT
jgi:hypothetical protein